MKKVNKIALAVTSVAVSSSLILPNYVAWATDNAGVANLATTKEVAKFNRATLKENEIVSVKGTVVSDVNVWGGNAFFVQTEDGQGIFIYPKKDLAVKRGNVVSLTGKVTKFAGQFQLIDIQDYKLVSPSANIVPNVLNVSQINDMIQGTYVELVNLNVSNLKSAGKYKNSTFTATDESGKSINVFIDNRTGFAYESVAAKIANGDKISLKGIVSASDKGLEIKPYTLNDITVVEKKGTATLEKVANIGTIQGENHTSSYQGKNVEVKDVVVTKVDKKGFYIQDINPDNNKNTSDAIYVVSKEKVNPGDKLLVSGIVTEGYGDGYADKAKTDLSITQIIADKVEKQGTSALPKAINISKEMPKNIIDNDGLTKFEPNEDAIDYWESIEGMLVEIEKPRVLGPQLHGEIYVLPYDYKGKELNNAGGLSLNPQYQNTEIIPILVGNRKYRAKAKDYFEENIQGVVTYTYGAYKVDALKMPDIKDGKLQRETSNIAPEKGKLTIASYNIENFSANPAKGETSNEKVEKIAKSFINEIHTPDIISLIEVQDNNGGVDDGTVSGVESGNRLAKKIKELGGPEYSYVEVAPVNNVDGGKPGANIRVAFLYNSSRVKLANKEIGGSTEAATFVNGHLAKNPSRIEPTNPAFDSVRKSLAAEFEFDGENIVVIANHLKSKRGDDSVYGRVQPAIENSQVSRIEQAQIINNFVKQGLAQNPNLKFVLTGDFNDFEFSKTLKAIEGNELTNLLSRHTFEDRYSYFFRGNNQSLDNIVVSKNISDKTEFDAVHVNSSFMEEDGRASDHDPLVVRIDFTKEEISKEDVPTVELPEGVATEVPDTAPTVDEKPTYDISKLDKVLVEGSFDVFKPTKKLGVIDTNNLTEKEKATLKQILTKINNKNILVSDIDEKGNVVLTDFELGKEYNIAASDLVEKIETYIPEETPMVELPEAVIVEKDSSNSSNNKKDEQQQEENKKEQDKSSTKSKVDKKEEKVNKKLAKTGLVSTTTASLGLGLLALSMVAILARRKNR